MRLKLSRLWLTLQILSIFSLTKSAPSVFIASCFISCLRLMYSCPSASSQFCRWEWWWADDDWSQDLAQSGRSTDCRWRVREVTQSVLPLCPRPLSLPTFTVLLLSSCRMRPLSAASVGSVVIQDRLSDLVKLFRGRTERQRDRLVDQDESEGESPTACKSCHLVSDASAPAQFLFFIFYVRVFVTWSSFRHKLN